MEYQTDNAGLRARLAEILARQRQSLREEGPPRVDQRNRRLLRLEHKIRKNREAIVAAVDADFGGRARQETLAGEIYTTLAGIRHARRRLWWWMRTRRPLLSPLFFPASGEVRYQPLGVVGIISPWNYPFHLAVAPLAQAIAAGNRVMLKPSEMAPATSALLDTLLSESFPEEEVAVVRGGADVGAAFSALRFDHLFFTGSNATGRKVLAAAAEQLVPVTLELGGKSPAMLGERCALDPAARAIAKGKLFNAGQTCVAPDYVLLPENWVDAFVSAYTEAVGKLYPTLVANPQYSSIVSEGQMARLRALVDDARAKGARVIEINPAGESFDGTRKFPPMLVIGQSEDMALMQEEIFGPVLPVVTFKDEGEGLEYIRDRPRPLALYYFSTDWVRVRHLLRETVSGGVCVNDTLLQAVQEGLPFGGIGASGMGCYHGFHGFATFSHAKPVFYQHRYTPTGLFHAPYGRLFDWAMRLLIR